MNRSFARGAPSRRPLALALFATASGAALAGSPSPAIDLRVDDRASLSRQDGEGADPSRPVYFDLHDAVAGSARADYRMVADKGTNFRVWIDKDHPAAGAGDDALGMRITSDRDLNVKDKIVVNVVPGTGPLAIDPYSEDRTRYLSFDFFLPADYQVPHGWLLHMQVFQCCGGVPPFTIHVDDSTPGSSEIRFLFYVSDDGFRTHPVVGLPGRLIYRMTVPRERWQRMTLRLRPGPIGTPGPAGVAMWLDGRKAFDWAGPWGYAAQGRETQNMSIDLGLYRRRQARTQTILFRNVEFGATSAVDRRGG